jgi:hypothetical protein
MAKRKIQKRTPEEKARQLENQRRLEEIIQRRLAQEAVDPDVQARRAQRSS